MVKFQFFQHFCWKMPFFQFSSFSRTFLADGYFGLVLFPDISRSLHHFISYFQTFPDISRHFQTDFEKDTIFPDIFRRTNPVIFYLFSMSFFYSFFAPVLTANKSSVTQLCEIWDISLDSKFYKLFDDTCSLMVCVPMVGCSTALFFKCYF